MGAPDRIKIFIRGGHESAAALEEEVNTWLAKERPHIRGLKFVTEGGAHRVFSVMIWYAGSPPGGADGH